MSTQRRNDRSTRTAEGGRRVPRLGSRLSGCKDGAGISGDRFSIFRARKFPAIAAGQTAPPAMLPVYEATNSLQADDRNQQQLVRLFSFGSPPTGRIATLRPFPERSSGNPSFPSPVLFARLHRILPSVPAA